ncbi:S8 family serine peptidase [bacterium]|nr:S8 family serine peptidase [bacterium]
MPDNKSYLYIYLLPFIFIILICFNGYGAGPFSHTRVSTPSSQLVPLIIIMEQQAEANDLQAFKLLSIEERRDSAISILKGIAENTQAPIFYALRQLEQEGIIKGIRSLWIINAISLYSPEEWIPQLEQLPGIRKVTIDHPQPALLSVTTPSDTTWGLTRIQALEIRENLGLMGKSVLLAILDTGVGYNHPDLFGQIWRNLGEIPYDGIDNDSNGYVDDWHGYNFADSSGEVADNEGHGTHVAGSIVGDGSQGTYIGVAPEARLMVCKVLSSSGSGRQANAWEGVQYAVQEGAQAMNLSIGWRYTDGGDRSSWRTVVSNAVAAGVVMVIAAGNERSFGEPPPNNMRTPGDVPEALTIGSTTFIDSLSSFSSIGPVGWGEIEPFFDYPYPPGLLKPDISAPGSEILSSTLGGGYGNNSGTSMASPHVTGTVALMLQANPELSPEEVKGFIQASAVDRGPAGPDSLFGAGRLNSYQAVLLAMEEVSSISGTCLPPAIINISPGYLTFFCESPGGEYSAILKADTTYQITFSQFGYYPETLYVYLPPDTALEIDISLSILPTITVNMEVRDFDSGEPVRFSKIHFQDDHLSRLDGDSLGLVVLESIPIFTDIGLTIACPGYASEIRNYRFRADDGDQTIHVFLHAAFDFESDSGSLFTTGAINDDWEWGIPGFGPDSARSGVMVWATGLDTAYSNTSDSRLYTPSYYLPSGFSPRVSFFHWYDSEATSWGFWDGGNLSISVDDDSFRVIYPENGYRGIIDPYDSILAYQPAFSGTTGGDFWHQVQFDLTPFEGSEVSFMFHFGSDDNTIRPGWYIDDLSVIPRMIRGPWIYYQQDSFFIACGDSFPIRCRVLPVINPVNPSLSWAIYSEDSLFFSPDSIPFTGFYSDSYYAAIPPVPGAERVYYYLVFRDSAGIASVSPEGAPHACFAFWVGSDTTPPVIRVVQRPYYQAMDRSGSYVVKADIYDNWLLDSSSVYLYWRKNRGPENAILFDSRTEDLYLFNINAPAEVGDLFDFYISASDAALSPNTTRYPETDYLSFEIVGELFWDFESGADFTTLNGIWQWGAPDGIVPFSGDQCWGTILNDSYPPNSRDFLYLPPLKLAGFDNFTLTFWHWYAFAGDASPYSDGGNIQLVNTSDSIYILTPLSGYDGISTPETFGGNPVFGDSSGDWRMETINLNPYADDYIQIRFAFAADHSIEDLGWYIDAVRIDTSFLKIADTPNNRPGQYQLLPAFPNPFNLATRICYILPGGEHSIKLGIYNLQGKIVKQLAEGEHEGGQYTVIWNGRNDAGIELPSGIYFISFIANNNSIVNTLLLLK